MKKLKILDESGDRKYFTQLPNIVLNHSTAIDQALYSQMKRYAGENGVCFATQETLMKKMGIGIHAFRKSLDYLLKRGWIKYVGLKGGKTRPIKTYSITDIWAENIENYEKIPAGMAVSSEEIPASLEGDTCQISSKIPARSAVEEDLQTRRTNKNIKSATQALQGDKLSPLIELFKDVNPTYTRLFANKTERAALDRLCARLGEEKVSSIIKILPKVINLPYAPRITTPYQLEKKFGELAAFINQERAKKNKFEIGTV